MGKTIIPTYRLEVYEKQHKQTLAWKGLASKKRLESWIHAYIKSLGVGGANYHISKSLGRMPIPTRARLVHQKTGREVVTWVAPAFMAI